MIGSHLIQNFVHHKFHIMLCCICSPLAVPQCVSTVQVQTRTCSSITYTWTRPSPGLQYSTQVCPKDTPLCSNIINCTDCMSLTATGLSPNTNYTITIVSASSAGCVSQGCLDNVATASTQSISEFKWCSIYNTLAECAPFGWVPSLQLVI